MSKRLKLSGGLTADSNQQGRTFNEIFQAHGYVCKEGIKIARER